MMEEWILAIDRFSRLSDGDAPYWYNERANIGVLSAAAWRSGSVALEEFQHEKIDVENSENGASESENKWSGRCDLWVSNGKKSERIEAKFRWLNMASERMTEFADECLATALKDAEKSRSDDGQGAIGVAFFPLFVKESKVTADNSIEAHINKSISELCNIDADLVSWCFPIRLREHVSEKYRNQLPGIVMLAKSLD